MQTYHKIDDTTIWYETGIITMYNGYLRKTYNQSILNGDSTMVQGEPIFLDDLDESAKALAYIMKKCQETLHNYLNKEKFDL